jgi:hypothetical protein
VSNWIAVTQSVVHATLKSISHVKSSVAIKSFRIIYLFILPSSSWSVISHIAIPATGFMIGTQASIKESVDQQTEPIDVDQPEPRQSETNLIV